MFPDMYLQYNHPTIKSQQKPFDKNRQNLITLHPPQRRCHTPPTTHPPQRRCPSPPGTPQGNSAPATIQRSADGPPPSGTPPHLTPQKTRTDRLPAGRLHGRDPVRRSKPLVILGAWGLLCGHKPQSKPHLSEPGTHQRTWRVMGRPARQAPQTPSMTRRNDRTRHDHAAAPLAVCPFVPPSIHPSHPHKKRAPRPKHPGTLPKLKYPIIINRYQLSPTITQHAAETSESPSHWKPSQSQPQDS